ncbi:LapD/MoxY N-terminal periplasmic domain-containing protein [Corticimicrobacter populi]|uniref:Diguanylate cyclase n=1 Tax=Corticimicrobacter populi TaxID=2175229 RepID=A0A2V1JXM0_9BURK|nr:LapD/MoxY N-terminal periplasmic domain-containing protein [Corticimicrobacter populi]PWF21748.1 diguanylate cyclase [Corticimicrobacter populi]
MSLLRQLLLSVTLAMICILAGTLAFSIGSARGYLNEQLSAQGENAAATLALVLSQSTNQDPVTRELIMMALFDTAQFSEVRFSDTDGKVIFERKLGQDGESASTAPDWFNRLLPLTTGAAQRGVADGWTQVGVVSLTPHDGYAREALWRSSVRILVLVLVAGAAWALFAVWMIRWLKRALVKEVMNPVQSVGMDDTLEERQAPPVMAELASVSQAIHAMRERVRTTAQEQHAQIEQLQLELHTDAVTGLATRRYFVNELRRLLQLGGTADESVQQDVTGHALVFRLRDLAAINQQMTRVQTDEWLRSVAQALAAQVRENGVKGAILARLNGSDLALLLPGVSALEANRQAQRLLQVLTRLRVTLDSGRQCRWSLALTDYVQGEDVAAVMGRLDQALMRAENAGHGEIEYLSGQHQGGAASTGEGHWRQLLETALSRDQLLLSLQRWCDEPASGAVADVVRCEATLGLLTQQNEVLSAYMFMPAAVRVGLSAECDLRALALALSWLEVDGRELVLKVSLASLAQVDFRDRAMALLARHERSARHLFIELDAFALSAQGQRDYGVDVQQFCAGLAQAGVRFGLRRLTQQLDALRYLDSLALAYVKLGSDFVDDLPHHVGAQAILGAIMQTMIAMQAQAVADGSVTAEAAEQLREAGVRIVTLQSEAETVSALPA